MKGGGDEEDRTPDLRIANATLSQLSYVPGIANYIAIAAGASAVWMTCFCMGTSLKVDEFSSGGGVQPSSPAGVRVPASDPFAPASPGRYNLDPLGT